jgi:hypothetical protein
MYYNLQWSKTEKQIARAAFEQALARECAQIIAGVRERAGAVQTMDEVWQLNDHLNELARELPRKYDYRCSQLNIVFARLINEGWLTLDELAGLAEDKLEPIRFMTR